MYNKDLARKNENFCKKKIFFQFFCNFLHILEAPKKFYCSICNKFWKRNFKKGFSGTSQIVRETKSPILMSLALLLWKLQTSVWWCGTNWPTLASNRVKEAKETKSSVWSKIGSFQIKIKYLKSLASILIFWLQTDMNQIF